MRDTGTLTIPLPPAMAEQMERVQREDGRSIPELLYEAWSQYFEHWYGDDTPTARKQAAINKVRAEIKRGAQRFLHDLETRPRKARSNGVRKNPS
jgi:hypothetical protein